MVALGARQPVGVDHARCRDAQVARAAGARAGRRPRRPRPRSRRRPGRRRRPPRPARAAPARRPPLPAVRSRSATWPSTNRAAAGSVASTSSKRLAGDLEQRGVAAGAHGGRARLAGEQRELAEHLRRGRARAPPCRRRPPRAGRCARRTPTRAGRPGGSAPRRPAARRRRVARSSRCRAASGSAANSGSVGEVDGVGRAPSRAGRPSRPAGSAASTTAGRSSATVLVLGADVDPAERAAASTATTTKATIESTQPSCSDATTVAGVGSPRMTTRIAMPSTPPSWRALETDRGCRGVAATGHRGQGRAAEQRQGGPDADAAEHLARQPLGPERRLEPDPLVVPEVGGGPHERAGHDERRGSRSARPAGRAGRPPGRRRARRAPGPGRRAARRSPRRTAATARWSAGRRRSRSPRPPLRRTEVERPQPQQHRVEHRRAVPSRADHEQHQGHGGADERAEHLRAGPAPVGALDDAEVEQRQARRRAGRRRRGRASCAGPGARLSTSWWRAAHTATRPKGRLTRNAQRQPPSSTSAPPIGGPTPGGDGGRGAPHADGVRAPLGRERRDDQGQRGRHEHRGAERLDHPGEDEQLDRRREPAQRGGDGEHGDAGDERPPPTDAGR